MGGILVTHDVVSQLVTHALVFAAKVTSAKPAGENAYKMQLTYEDGQVEAVNPTNPTAITTPPHQQPPSVNTMFFSERAVRWPYTTALSHACVDHQLKHLELWAAAREDIDDAAKANQPRCSHPPHTHPCAALRTISLRAGTQP